MEQNSNFIESNTLTNISNTDIKADVSQNNNSINNIPVTQENNNTNNIPVKQENNNNINSNQSNTQNVNDPLIVNSQINSIVVEQKIQENNTIEKESIKLNDSINVKQENVKKNEESKPEEKVEKTQNSEKNPLDLNSEEKKNEITIKKIEENCKEICKSNEKITEIVSSETTLLDLLGTCKKLMFDDYKYDAAFEIAQKIYKLENFSIKNISKQDHYMLDKLNKVMAEIKFIEEEIKNVKS